MSDYSQAGLIIVGHGSTVNPDSSTPTHQHADTLRARGLFREVGCCFWKEEPNMLEVFEMMDSRVLYIVPNFISEGYFCQQVLPRELRLDGPVTKRGDREIRYCDPVGIHPNMTRLLLQRADEVAQGVPREQTSLVIVGHGTSLNENSTKAIQDQVHLIRGGGYGFAEVIDAYMEEAPFVADWAKLTTAANVVVVPFFIADGLHSYQDIPVLLGIEQDTGKALSETDVFRHNPISLQGRQLYYSSAIGTEPLMAEVILDQIHDFDARHGPAEIAPAGDNARTQALRRWIEAGRHVLGQAAVTPQADGTFTLSHLDDLDRLDDPELKILQHPADARAIATHDPVGAYRPLKTAPTLRSGWRLDLATLDHVRQALDFLYPAALGMALAEETGSLQPVSVRDLLGRQTGMYRFANTITDDDAQEMIGRCCASSSKCLRRITWPLSGDQPLTGAAAHKTDPAISGHAGDPDRAIPLLCMEACNHIVAESRRVAKAAFEKKSTSSEPAA